MGTQSTTQQRISQLSEIKLSYPSSPPLLCASEATPVNQQPKDKVNKKKSTNTKTRAKRRSRKGCESCKKLKIKCNESKPSCEYCLHRGKKCIYPYDLIDQRVSPIELTSEEYLSLISISINNESLYLDDVLESSCHSTDNLNVCSVADSKFKLRNSTPNLLHSVGDANLIHGQQLQKPRNNLTDLSRCDQELCPDGNLFNGDNRIVQRLNSLKSQLGISSLELRLLKFFTDFGSSFFSLGKAPETARIWEIDVPELWKTSDMLRNSLYALSAVKLWSFYQTGLVTGKGCTVRSSVDVISEIVGESDSSLLENLEKSVASEKSPGDFDYQYSNNDCQILETIYGYFSKALSSMLNLQIGSGVESNATSVISNILLFAMLSTHPALSIPLLRFKSDNQVLHASFDPSLPAFSSDILEEVDVMDIFRILSLNMTRSFSYILGTRYERLGYYESGKESVAESYPQVFPFIDHLSNYVNLQFRANAITCDEYFTYINVINIIKETCLASITNNFPIPIFMGILQLAADIHFSNLLRQKQHVSCKIFFYYTALCSIFVFKLFPVNTMWDEFNEFYRLHSFTTFQSGWEDSVDMNIFKLLKYIEINKDLFFFRRVRYMAMLTDIGKDIVTHLDQNRVLVSVNLKKFNVHLDCL